MPSEADLVGQIEAIVNGEGTKSAKARALYALGCDRTDAVELIGMNYSQAHSVWAQVQSGIEPVGRGRRSEKQQAIIDRKAENRMRFSPTQVRYVTQSGHRIIRVDDHSGQPICRECQGPLTFSIEWLAFLHTFSTEEPKDIEDHYHGEDN